MNRAVTAAVAAALAFAVVLPPATAEEDGRVPLTKVETRKLEAWIRALDDEKYAVRAEAHAALRAFGARGLHVLREAEDSKSEEVRARVRLLITVLEASLSPEIDTDSNWITLKGNMGRTGARGAAPLGAIEVKARSSVGGGRDARLDAPLALYEGVLVVAREDRVIGMDSTSLKHKWAVGVGSRILASPVVSDGRLFVGTAEGLSAYSMETRKEIWSVAAPYGVGAAPLVTGNTLYACLGDEAVVALDPATGVKRWRHPCAAGRSAPVLVGEQVVLGTKDRKVIALDRTNGEETWSLDVDGRMAFAPATVGSSVIVGDGGRRLRCIDAESGRVLWKRSIRGHFQGDGPALSKRALVFTTQNRIIQAYEPSTGERLWSRDMGTTHLSSPAIAGRYALFGSRTKLVVVEASTGDDVWTLDLDGEVASPLVANESVYALAGSKLVAVR